MCSIIFFFFCMTDTNNLHLWIKTGWPMYTHTYVLDEKEIKTFPESVLHLTIFRNKSINDLVIYIYYLYYLHY